MLEAVFLHKGERDTRQDTYASLAAAVLFTALAIILTHNLLPFEVDGTSMDGLIAVLIASIALSYPLTTYIRQRDSEELQKKWQAETLLRRHASEVSVYLACFLGATLTFAVAATMMSDPQQFFHAQFQVLEEIQSLSGQITQGTLFGAIIKNNLSLFFITFALSFFVTGGMVFILLWNASVLGVLVGSRSATVLSIPHHTAPYFAHGMLEIAAYVLAGLAGSLLAYSFEHYFVHDTHSRETFEISISDSLAMLTVGVVTVILAAIIEVGV